MELVEIELSNFRQFEAFDGKPQRITFAPPGERNVTAIYGTNGAGKSGLLNAFTWAIFGETTTALKHPGNLVNQNAVQRAAAGTSVTGRVQLTFYAQVDGRRCLHVIERETSVTAQESLSADALGRAPKGRSTLRFAKPGGGTAILTTDTEIDARIRQILPPDLFQYFFIDGERIANLAQPKNADDVRHAVEVFVGLRELIEGREHLDAAALVFDAEARRHERNNAALELNYGNQEGKRGQLNSVKAELDSLESNIAQYNDEVGTISRRLAEKAETRALEEQRKHTQGHLDTRREAIKTSESELFRLLMTQGWYAFAKDAACVFLTCNIDLRKKGELPYSIRRPFIEELLERGFCICERTLREPGKHGESAESIAKARSALDDQLQRSGVSEVQSQLFGATSVAKLVAERREALPARLTALDHEIRESAERAEELELQLKDLSIKLKGGGEDEVAELAKRREHYETKLREAGQKKGLLTVRREQLEKELEGLQDQARSLRVNTSAGRVAIDRAELCRRVAKAMDQLHGIERKSVREKLEKRVADFFRDYSILGYVPRVSEQYSLSLEKLVDGVVYLVSDSTGEGQALSLAFISAVASLAIDRKREETFPLVIDSQFGSLDKPYHRRIGSRLPERVGQVILIQTKTQWTDEMRAAVRKRLGAEVVMTRTVTAHGGRSLTEEGNDGLSPDEIVQLENGTYPYIEMGTSDSTRVRQAFSVVGEQV